MLNFAVESCWHDTREVCHIRFKGRSAHNTCARLVTCTLETGSCDDVLCAATTEVAPSSDVPSLSVDVYKIL